MGEIVLKMRRLVETAFSDPALGRTAQTVRQLLTEPDTEGRFEGFSTKKLAYMLNKRNSNLDRQNIDHGGFKETIQNFNKKDIKLDLLDCIAGGYYIAVWIDPKSQKAVGMVYVKQAVGKPVSRKEFWDQRNK